MPDWKVTYIIKSKNRYYHKKISHLGNKDWPIQCLTVEEVIMQIRLKTDRFFIEDIYGQKYWLGIIIGNLNVKEYLRAYSSNIYNDLLLQMPEKF